MPEKDFCVLILAAGLGTRMKSDLPKVLHMLGDMPLAARVIKKVSSLGPSRIVIVVGHKADMVRETLGRLPADGTSGAGTVFVTQKLLKGSGRAVLEALPEIKGCEHTMVLCGDAPLFRTATLARMKAEYLRTRPDCMVLTAELDEPGSYGRIKRSASGAVEAIVEAAGASAGDLAIKEVNSGTYFFRTKALAEAVRALGKKGPKGEYYLTDSIENILASGGRVTAFKTSDRTEITGINSRRDLAAAYKMLNRRVIGELMDGGVTIMDPDNTYIEEGVRIGRDTVIYPGTHISGSTVIGRGCRIGPYGVIDSCRIDTGAEIKFACCLTSSRVRAGSVIGPFARLRPASDVGPKAEVGNFAEVKKSRIGRGSKMHHHSYVGDTVMGPRVNIGAGTITCNYDGLKKNPTSIGAGAFIGSNTNLVAPVRIGAGAYTAAGSTITEDVPGGTLAIARARQVIKRRNKR